MVLICILPLRLMKHVLLLFISAFSVYSQQPPCVSLSSGWIKGDSLSLTARVGDTIYYTLDGSVPNPRISSRTYHYKNHYPEKGNSNVYGFCCDSTNTHIYTNPIYITNDNDFRLRFKSSTFDESPNYFPSAPLPRGNVIRAMSTKENRSSSVVTHTYFHDSVTHNLPVVSIAMNADELFDYHQGIYCAGKDFENWRARNSRSAQGGVPANWQGKGSDFARSAHVEWFNDDTLSVKQTLNVRIHGGSSRIRSRKSLRLYPLKQEMLQLPHFSHSGYTEFHRVLLRNAGNDANTTLFRDAFMQHLVRDLHVDIQHSTPVVVYLNGEYWGIHNLREWQNHHYIHRKYGIGKDAIDFIKEKRNVKKGDAYHFREMMAEASKETPSFQTLSNHLDMDGFIDYIIANVYVRNTDWPHNNIKVWRKKMDYGEGVHDGRLRWLHNDLDHGFGLYGGWEAYAHNTLNYAKKSFETGLLLKSLLQNDTFAVAFANRFCDVLNTTFLPEHITSVIDSFMSLYEPEIERHFRRWDERKTIETWRDDIDVLRTFAEKRPDHLLRHLAVERMVQRHHKINVHFKDGKEGNVILNSIPINRHTLGYSADEHQWSGRYLEGHPIKLRALSNEHARFSHWVVNGKKHRKAQLEITLDDNSSIEVVYK